MTTTDLVANDLAALRLPLLNSTAYPADAPKSAAIFTHSSVSAVRQSIATIMSTEQVGM